MAIASDKNSEIIEQQLRIAINTTTGGVANIPLLPYDPSAPSDSADDIQYLATNEIDNSDFDFSKDDYVNNPTVGGDPAQDAYNFYRQRFIQVNDVSATAASPTINAVSAPFNAAYTYPMDFVLLNAATSGAAISGTLTRVSNTQATLSVNSDVNLTGATLWFGDALAETDAMNLKASGHSLFAANEGTNLVIPRWDRTNGWAELGSNSADTWDIATPLPLNLVRGGLRFFFRVIISLRSGAVTDDPVRMFAGIWDATAAQKRFLESTNFNLSVAPVPAAAATTYTYKIIADLDNGRTIASNSVTIATGPATLSTTTYNRLTWENATGLLRFRIYRETGGVVKRVFTITNGAHEFNDIGMDEGETPVTMPGASERRPIAYAVSGAFNPTTYGIWQSVNIIIDIPGTYDTSATTGRQWLRFGLEGVCGDVRMLLVDRVLLSTSNGGWQRSARDRNRIANPNPSSLPTSTTQGGQGINTCFVLDTPILVCDEDGSNFRTMPIGEAEKGMFVFSGATRVHKIVDVKDGLADTTIEVELSNGVSWECSPSEKFITSRADRQGTRIDNLTLGDEILTWKDGRVSAATIEKFEIYHWEDGKRVRTLSLTGGKTFCAGRGGYAIAHNEKPQGGGEF